MWMWRPLKKHIFGDFSVSYFPQLEHNDQNRTIIHSEVTIIAVTQKQNSLVTSGNVN